MEELISEFDKKNIPFRKRKLFKNLGMGPSLTILSFFAPEEIMLNLRRVNKEALILCR